MTDPKKKMFKKKPRLKGMKRLLTKEADASFSASISTLTMRHHFECSFGVEEPQLVSPVAKKVVAKKPFWLQDPISPSKEERRGARMHLSLDAL